jgi:hypothetical protein
MPTEPTDVSASAEQLLAARAKLPQHVVHRSFVAETIILNLNTGKYHGLNPTAGRMLEAVDGAPTVRTAVPALADEYGVEAARIEADLVDLLRGLQDRGLIEISDAGPG